MFPVTTSGDANDEMPASLEQELVEALETDDQVTGEAVSEQPPPLSHSVCDILGR